MMIYYFININDKTIKASNRKKYYEKNPLYREATQEEIENLLNPKPTVKDYEFAIEKMINDVARANDFNSIDSCAKYTTGNNKFKEHAQALIDWCALCWEKSHEILNTADVNNPPTIQEVLDQMPKFIWNKPVYPKINK